MSRKRRAEPLHRALARRALDGAALCADGQPLLRSLPPARCVPVRADAARACLGVVMVGWSRDGDSLVSYSVEQTEASTPATRASLYAQWWRFTPGAPLERIGEVRLFRWMTAAVEPSAVRVDVLELADHWVFHGSFGGSGALERSEALTVAAKDGSEEPYDAAVEAHPPYLAPAVLFVPAPSDWPRGAGYLLWSVGDAVHRIAVGATGRALAPRGCWAGLGTSQEAERGTFQIDEWLPKVLEQLPRAQEGARRRRVRDYTLATIGVADDDRGAALLLLLLVELEADGDDAVGDVAIVLSCGLESGSLRVRWCGVPPPAAVADGAARRRWACAVALSYRRRCSPPTPARDAPHWLDNRTVTDSGVTVDALLHPTLPLGLAGWEPG